MIAFETLYDKIIDMENQMNVKRQITPFHVPLIRFQELESFIILIQLNILLKKNFHSYLERRNN